MLEKYLVAPSFNALFLTGFLLLVVFILSILNFTSFKKLNYYQQIIFLAALTNAVGIHGLLHLGLEKQYKFNPYKWINLN
jgi:hypothetical protein